MYEYMCTCEVDPIIPFSHLKPSPKLEQYIDQSCWPT